MIHRYKMGGYNIVIDANSGSVHVVDEAAYDVIGMYEEKTEEEILDFVKDKYNIDRAETKELLGDIEALKEDGVLFSEDIYREAAPLLKNKTSVIKALCLLVAQDCNMRCQYCFAEEGEYNQGERRLMSFETGKRAIDFLVENSGTRVNLEVDFFGGEPLMNFDVVKQLVEYSRSIEKEHNKNFRFTLTTNGILLNDEICEFLNKEMYNVVLSIDGRKEVNDKMRKTVNGGGTYDIILPKFKKAADSRGQENYYLRGTYTHYNTDFVKDILHLADMGFKQLSMEPVVCSADEPYALTEEDLPKLLEQYEFLASEMLKRKDFTFYHYMIDLKGGPCIYKRVSGCGVGVEYMAVTPSGDLYPCHQFVGDDECKLGDVFNGITYPERRDNFRGCNIYAHKECDDCFARFYCSGGCVANAYHSTGDIKGVYEYGCKLHRKRIECAIMMKAAEEDAD
ncbi:MAG: thioether cross-link-forming SCIFF peptide maturase [Clostridiales bacterium]|nr:thioether cross-link-forming SCIFF peptide maturase [Clostridiales bacterium]